MKKLIAMLMALVMVLGLAACGSAPSTPSTTAPAQTAAPAAPAQTEAPAAPSVEKVDISVIAAQYGQNTNAWWENFVKEFNAEYENINLTVEVISWNDIKTVVNTRIANG